MKILIIVSEVAPFSYVGGLARGTYSLAKALTKRGHDVRIATPMHRSVVTYAHAHNLKLIIEKTFRIPKVITKKKNIHNVRVKSVARSDKNECMYFVDDPDYFGLRSRVYGYGDDYKRYYLFSRVCAELLLSLKKEKGWFPDIIQCHDWHTGYFVDLCKRTKHYSALRKIPIVFTVHNYKYQNEIKFQYMDEESTDMGKEPLAGIDAPGLQYQNALTRGMLFSDAVNTVSPTHAEEMKMPGYEFSYNLKKVIRSAGSKLSGILNGLDYKEFDPLSDQWVRYNYSEKNAEEFRSKNKQHLRRIFSLPDKKNEPLFCYVGRMSSQKGLEFLFAVMSRILGDLPAAQFIGIGDGEDYYCEALWRLSKRFPRQVGIKLVHDIHLPRQIFAGSDMLIVPSNYEPGGIVALEALRYGCIPVVRRTGGLNDIIADFSTETLQGNGFSYKKRNERSLYNIIMKALSVYRRKHHWHALTQNAMAFRNTWDNAAVQYELLFSGARVSIPEYET